MREEESQQKYWKQGNIIFNKRYHRLKRCHRLTLNLANLKLARFII